VAHECAPTNKQPAEPEVAHGAAVLQLCAPERPISLVLLLLLLLILLSPLPICVVRVLARLRQIPAAIAAGAAARWS